MESWTNPWVIILVATGLVTAIFGYIFLKYPPKKINWFYGYRTTSSMKSQERWDFAQGYSAREMIRTGLYMIPAGLLGGWLELKPSVSAFFSIPVTLLFFGIMLFRTERALRERFGK